MTNENNTSAVYCAVLPFIDPYFYSIISLMLHGNSVKLLTGMHSFSSLFLFINPFLQGNSHPELAAAVAER